MCVLSVQEIEISDIWMIGFSESYKSSDNTHESGRPKYMFSAKQKDVIFSTAIRSKF